MVDAMKRTLLAAAVATTLSAPALGADRRFTVTDFDRIQVEGPFTVVLRTGKAPSARAIGSAKAMDRVSIDVQGRTLKLRPNRSAWGGDRDEETGPIRIELSTHDLRGASLTGSGSLGIDHARGLRFDLTLSGSGRIDVGNVEADNLSLGMLGSGQVNLVGDVKSFRGTVQGSGTFDGTALQTEDAQLNAETSGTIDLAVRRTAKVVSTGAGEINIAGKPACTVKALGSGRVRCGR